MTIVDGCAMGWKAPIPYLRLYPHHHVTMDAYPGRELTVPQLLHALEGKLDQLMKLSTRCDLFWSAGRQDVH